VYQLFTKFRSPVFLGSSFAFLGSMFAAFAGAASVSIGYIGLIVGAVFAGLVYVILALIVKFAGVEWINKLMPPVIIGPVVAIIGLSLAGNAVGDMTSAGYLGLVCALVTLFAVIISSVYGTKGMKLVPFIIGIGAGYVLALILSVTGAAPLIEMSKFKEIDGVFALPQFSFLNAWAHLYLGGHVFLGVLLEELLASLTVRTIELVLLGNLIERTLLTEQLLSSIVSEHGRVALNRIDKAPTEQVADDGVGRILELLRDTGQHTLVDLTGDVETNHISLLLRIARRMKALTQTTDEISHHRGVHLLLKQISDQTIGE
jgi:hypothetical protein